MATNEYNSNTGVKLAPGESYTNASGQVITQGSAYAPISSLDLKPTTPMVLPNATIPPDTNSTSALIATTAAANKAEQAKVDAAKLAKDNALKDVTDANLKIAGQTAKQDQYFVAEGGDVAKKAYDDYTSQLEAEQLANTRAVEDLTKNFQGTTTGLNSAIAAKNRESLSKQADLAILQNSALRKYDTASAIAARKVAAETDYLKADLETKKMIYQDNKDAFTLAEQRQIDKQLKDDERAYNETVKTKTDINNVLLEAAKNNAPKSVIDKISAATSSKDAIAAAGTWMSDPLDRAIKAATLAKTKAETAKIKNAGADAPTIKTINGVDMQWNGKEWVTPTSTNATLSKEAVDKSLSQLKFLKDTATSITGNKEIYGAAGRSSGRKFVENLVVGSTDYTKLESYANTLKTNVLALMTDPSIKKFFGPQMSNADVTLMTSAGTTINPELQDPETLKNEVVRLQDLFDRMEKSVKSGTKEYQYIDTISSAIDKSGTALSPESYAQSLMAK